jgi:Dyp-type peroxidase family
MPKAKYYDRVNDLESIDLDSNLPAFDLEKLRAKGITSKIASTLFRSPRTLLKILRWLCPTLRIGGFVLVTRADDVREILTNTKVFTVPFGAEMRVVSGGGDFILGANDGAVYRAQKKIILKAFPPQEMAASIDQITQRAAQRCKRSMSSDINPIEDLIKPSALAVCEEYFGLRIGNKDRFYESSLAVSSLLFADVFGNSTVRELAMSGAKYMLEVIDLSIHKSKVSSTNASSALDKLVQAHLADPVDVPLKDVRAIMMGMILGFLPTTMLGTGNALEVILARAEAHRAVLDSINEDDDAGLESVIAEAMRFNPIQIGPFRLCDQDYVVAEGTRRQKKIPKDSLVIPSTLSAMFDPKSVEQPDNFMPSRDSQDSMIFGYGLHSCIGAPMASAFSTQIFKILFSLPNLRGHRGKAGRMTRIGIFPETIRMSWDQVEKYGDLEQSLCSICIPVKNEAKLSALQSALESLGNVACTSPEISAGNQTLVDAMLFSDELHFASGCISPAYYKEEKLIDPAHLLFEITGDRKEHLLVGHFADVLEPILGDEIRDACDFDASETLSSIFISHRIPKVDPLNRNLGLNFNGTPGHSVKRIKKEAELSKTIYDLVLNEQVSPATNSLERLKIIREKVASEHDFNWAFTSVRNRLSESEKGLLKYLFDYVRQPWSLAPVLTVFFFIYVNFQILGGAQDGFLANLGQVGAAISMTVIGAILLIGCIASLIIAYLRRLEKRDPADLVLPEQNNYDEVTSRENQLRHNHMFSVSRIKPSFMRPLLLRAVLWSIKLSAGYKNPPGIISVISSIHFARWVRIPGTRQLVFFSNYGGSWESYLEDFITKGSAGLSSIWSNTIGFPRTRYLAQRGAKLSEPFKYWARQQQRPTPFWYVAYPNLTTGEIRKNAKIREGFANINDVREADQWFSLFGSSYRPRAGLDKSNIQSLVFGGMGKRLPNSKLLFVSFAAQQKKQSVKTLMRHIINKVDFGETLKNNHAWQIAFTYRGLQRLGLSDEDTDNRVFPNVFCQGVNSVARSRILGDLATSHPDNWSWGSGENEVDFVLMCYASEASKIDPSLVEVRKLIDSADAQVVWEQDCNVERNVEGAAVEPFGYVDGISQPIIKGTIRSQHTDQLDHLVAPGEVLCGYPDERDNISPSPVVSIGKDILNVLPEEPFQSRQDSQKDFGFNGSYLVIRQLQQNVEAFDSFCETKAHELSNNTELEPITPEWVGAKMLGRWKDGRPLVRFSSEHKQGDPGNNFRYRGEDPQGLQCPLGAHIRRANPRDSLGDDTETQMSLSNRHRILRVGRPYKQPGSDERGLMFMCLNSDIERQFEFVQQTWLGNSSFHGLMGETDSVSSGECPIKKKFTIPSAQGSVTLTGLQSFVTTKGAAYLFMPGRQALRFLLNL